MSKTYYDSRFISKMDQRSRVNLINSLTGFKSVSLIGTINSQKRTNLAIFSQLVHVGADPPLIGVLFRPNTVKRDTLENIQSEKIFTLNHIDSSFYKKAHHTSARWNSSEFESCDLTPEYLNSFKAPFVEESSLKLGLEFKEQLDVKVNGTHLVIGEIMQIHIEENIIGDDGFVDLEKGGIITSSGLDSYHVTNRIARLSYAKPNAEPKEL